MRRGTRALVILSGALGVAATLSGCWSGDIVITQADADTVQTVCVGARIAVRLEGNPSTGYTWARIVPTDDELASSGLTPIEEGTWEFPDDELAPGAPGVCLFRYLAEGAGTTTLSFAYGRSWEPEPVQSCSVVIRVRD